MLGIDVSLFQPPSFPWSAAVAWGARFAFIRATDGSVLDAGYPVHRRNARAAGLLTGSYAMVYPYVDMARQAAAFLHETAGNDDELPSVLDAEADGLTAGHLSAWIAAYQAGTDRPLMIYTRATWWNDPRNIGPGHHEFSRFLWWIADYGNVDLRTDQRSTPAKAAPDLPDVCPAADVFQYCGDNGRIPNYSGAIDLDLWTGVWPMTTTDDALKLIQHAMADLVQAQGLLNPAPPAPAHWWDALPSGVFTNPIPYAAQAQPYNIYGADGKPLAVKPRTNAGQFFERQGDLLRVATVGGVVWWVLASEMTPIVAQG